MSISTEGLARACAGHPKRTLGIWLLAVLISFVPDRSPARKRPDERRVTSQATPTQSKRQALIARGFPPEPSPSEIVVVRSDRYTVDQPAFQAKVRTLGGAPLRYSALSRKRRVTTRRATSRSFRRIATRRWCRSLQQGDDVTPLVDLVTADERARRIPGLGNRDADGRRRLREALRGRSAEGRAVDRAACGADHSRCSCSELSWRASSRYCSGSCRSWWRLP